MLYTKIISSGCYLPECILTNQDLEQMVDTSDEWIVSRSGIKERRIVGSNETSSTMAFMAATDALNKAGNNFDKAQIDLILVATSTPDMMFPSTACLLQAKLGLNNIPAFDLQAACAGFLYAMHTADAYIKSKLAKCVLIIGVDTLSHVVDYTDRNTCVLFGDGAGAMLLAASGTPGILSSALHADGRGEAALNITGHIHTGNIIDHPYIRMDGKAVYKMAVKNLAMVANQVLEQAGFNSAQVDWLIPHQANIRIMEATAKHLSIPIEKVIITVDKHGNTSAASIPLAFDHAITNKMIKRGDLLLFEGVGAGFTWGASLVRY